LAKVCTRTIHGLSLTNCIRQRFHEEIKSNLERKRADVIELSQALTESMDDIHGAIVQCMTITLNELKRSRTDVSSWSHFRIELIILTSHCKLDLDNLSLPAAYFSSFDHIVRRQLDPVWHKVGASTKALVKDLGVLRRLVNYLLVYDPLQFHAFCETLIATASDEKFKSQWMLSDAANVIFQTAKRRCYTLSAPTMDTAQDDEWDVFDELHGQRGGQNQDRPKWIPSGMDPVLEELPKWSLLAEILEEIEGEITRIEGPSSGKCRNSAAALHPLIIAQARYNSAPGNNLVIVLCNSTATCTLVTEFLAQMDQKKPKGEWGRKMMLKRLRKWLWWRSQSDNKGATAKNDSWKGLGYGMAMDIPGPDRADDGISEALKRKDKERAEKRASRRRVRGGAPIAGPSTRPAPTQSSVASELGFETDLQL